MFVSYLGFVWFLSLFTLQFFNYGLCDIYKSNRLPNNTIPYNYELDIKIAMPPARNFKGNVKIHLTILQRTNEIVLHHEGLTLFTKNIFLFDHATEAEYCVQSSDYNEKNHLLQLQFDRKLNLGNYTLSLDYIGELSDDHSGLFALPHISSEGVEKWTVLTNLQPIGARRVLPCFDEPNFKATFTVKVTHATGLHAVSNGVTEWIEKVTDTTSRTTFKPTPMMSTYLLAIAVTEFNSLYTEHRSKNFTFYGEELSLDNLKYAMEMSVKSLHFMEKIFKLQYPLPKLDQISLQDFSGGMENWGLIMYSDIIVVDKDIPMNQSKMESVDLVMHEIAHQWFGNLVTCDWWQYTWLNEGFAQYFSKLLGDMFEPTARLQDFYSMFEIPMMLRLDSVLGTEKSLNEYVDDVDAVLHKFSRYTYQKGSAIVRLMHECFPADFLPAVGLYLQKYAFSTVTPEDLFNEFVSPVPNVSVAELMNEWTNKPSYPLMNVKINYKRQTVTITQKRFVRHCVHNSSYEEIKWWIPLTATQQNNPQFKDLEPRHWLRPHELSTTFSMTVKPNNWVIFNLQAVVPSRVNYNVKNWGNIIRYLNTSNYEKIHPINRGQLIEDSFHLALANELNFEVFFKLIEAISNFNEDIFIGELMNRNIATLRIILSRTELIEPYKNFMEDYLLRTNEEAYEEFKKKRMEPSKVETGIKDLLADKLSWEQWIGNVEEKIFYEEDFKEVKEFLSSGKKPVPIDLRIKLREAMVTAAENIVLKDSILNGRMKELKHILAHFN